MDKRESGVSEHCMEEGAMLRKEKCQNVIREPGEKVSGNKECGRWRGRGEEVEKWCEGDYTGEER